jgi:hypothetical protein
MRVCLPNNYALGIGLTMLGQVFLSGELRKAIRGVLNNNNSQGHIGPQAHWISGASGLFKKVRPARPQPVLRSERTSST